MAQDFLFKDKEFPANDFSLFLSGKKPEGKAITWMRPKEISKNPKFTVDGAKYSDVHQGKLGNCWFLSGIMTVASRNEAMFKKVVPQDQSFDINYTGKFRFNFWQYGEWKEVVIDDRLPTIDGRLIYCQNYMQPNEYWCPLLEKAYAKFYKCYEALDGGRPNDALVDMTGGISELINLRDTLPTDLHEILRKCRTMKTLMSGAIFNSTSQGGTEIRQDSGLYAGHAYSITDMVEVTVDGKPIVLLRVRNPWGKSEWNGDWSDGTQTSKVAPVLHILCTDINFLADRDYNWNRLSADDRKRIDNTDLDDGEFWMSYDDFVKNFDEIEMCHLHMDALMKEVAVNTKMKVWNEREYHGAWKGETAGGSPLSRRFWNNPQYKLKMESSGTVVISLMEVTNKLLRDDKDISIALYLYKMDREKRPKRIEYKNIYEHFAMFWPCRERTVRFEFDAATYYIIPCTYDPNKEANFYLRVFSDVPAVTSPVENFAERIDVSGSNSNVTQLK